ncbi:hypothetical protein [Dyadobacter sp. CY351]|uniref:hypothetical protein n=1 Tax=Dyadobacter sp. CY351 TaxID=2909337 RepID=UPI001F24C778|nr:hypothetical protein [Dyadobacter sp. CY351]MCF2518271.1 hypothetical protein [Dyadobacter sp. CY351]
MKSKQSFINLIFVLMVGVLWNPCSAQKKYEREFSIKTDAVPQTAADFVNSVFTKSKIHWYREESLTGNSIEAKLKHSKKRYSIEFDETGNIQDVEIVSSIDAMEGSSRATLTDNLGKEFSHYKIVKTQLHWNGPVAALKKSLLENMAAKGVQTRYELVLKGTRDKLESYFEVLAEENGAIVSIHQIVQRNTDNLIY